MWKLTFYALIIMCIGCWMGYGFGKEAQLNKMNQAALENQIILGLKLEIKKKDNSIKFILENMQSKNNKDLEEDLSRINEIREITSNLYKLSNQEVKMRLLQLD